jgi:hypothetical protein
LEEGFVGGGARIVDSKISSSFQNGVASVKKGAMLVVFVNGKVARLHQIMI